MIRKNFKVIILFLLLLLPSLSAKELEKVSLQFQWLHQFQFAGYYMAKEKGFYKDVGLEVEIQDFSGGVDIVDKVLNDEVQYATGRNYLIVEKSKGKKISLLSAVFQTSPLVLIVKKSSGINTIEDFRDKKIMLGGIKRSESVFAMTASRQIHKGDIQEIKTETKDKLQHLIDGDVDIISAYTSNEVHILEEKGIDINIFNPKDYGFEFYGDILFTSEDEILNHKQRAINFNNASLKGWKYAFDNIDETVNLILEKYNTQNKSKEALIHEATELKKLAYYKTKKLGSISTQKIQRIYDIYNIMGFVHNQIDMKKFIFEEDKNSGLSLTKKEKEYLENKIIKVCVHPNMYPYEFIRDGKHRGIASEYIKLLQTEYPLNLEIIQVENEQELFQNVHDDRCDMKPFALQKYNFISKNMNESDSYSQDNLVLITKQNRAFINEISFLRDKKIAVGSQAFKNYLNTYYPFLNIVVIQETAKIMQELKSSNIFGYFELPLRANHIVQTYGLDEFRVNLKLVDNPLKAIIGVSKKEPQLLSIINKLIKNVPEDEIKKIQVKWEVHLPYMITDYTLVWTIFGISLIIIFLFLYRQIVLNRYNKKLKSEIEKATAELLEKNKNFEYLLNTTLEAIIISDENSNIISCNKSGMALFKIKDESEFVGRSLIDFVADYELPKLQEALANEYDPPRPYDLVKADGEIFPTLASGRNIIMDGKKIRVSAVLDLTQIKKQEQQLFQQSRQAQMGEMISMIAHQWRQPLGAISTTAVNLQMKIELEAFDLETKEGIDKSNKYFLERLERINLFVHNLTTTIDDFRNFYKPDKKPVSTRLENVILKSLHIINSSLEGDNIEILEEYDPLDAIQMYDNEIMQVILNILKNAQDNFNEKEIENRQITIETSEKTIVICDNGGGVPEDIIDRIFDPYFSTKDEKNGTGLGLHMSKTIVEGHHNGSLSVSNTEDGVCFKIVIGEIETIDKIGKTDV